MRWIISRLIKHRYSLLNGEIAEMPAKSLEWYVLVKLEGLQATHNIVLGREKNVFVKILG